MSCHPKYACHQHNQMSKKMLKSKMVHHRKRISHHNSKLSHIYKIIQSKDINANQNLVNSMCESLYKKYYNRIANSPSTSSSEKSDYATMFYQLLFASSSSSNEDTTTTSQTLSDTELTELMENPDFTFYCQISSVSTSGYGPQYVVITNIRFEHALTPGKTYKFDLSDPSNDGFQLSLSPKKYSFQDVENIYFIDTPGTPGACVIYQPPVTISLYQVYIYNKLDHFDSGYDVFGRMFEQLIIEINYKITQQPRYTSTTSDQFITDLSGISDIRMIHNKGPKYYLEPYNQPTYGNIFNDKYFPNRQYGLKTGTYIILNKDWKNPFTILNGNNLENPNICLYGNPNKKESIYVQGITDISDAYYDFYYGTLFIQVSGDFGTIPFYSKKFGLNQMQSFFVYHPTSSAVISDLTDISRNKIIADLDIARLNIEFERVKQRVIKNSLTTLLENSDYDFDTDPNNILNYNLFNTLFKNIITLSSTILTTFANKNKIIIHRKSDVEELTYFSVNINSLNSEIFTVNDTSIDTIYKLQKISFILEKQLNTPYYKIRYNEPNQGHYYFDISRNGDDNTLIHNNNAYVTFDISYNKYNDYNENNLIAKKRYVYNGSSYQEDNTFISISTYFTNILRADFVYKMIDNFDFIDSTILNSQYNNT